MSSFQSTGKDQDGETGQEPDEKPKLSYQRNPYDWAGSGERTRSTKELDAYRGMIRLRELLRGGRISKAEYEAAKIELLFDRD
jgi:hypothetical protein